MNTLSSILKFIANGIAPIISSQTAKKVLAAPNGAAGVPSFRELGASDITSGTFTTDRIPNLDASKVNSGVLTDARIPNLDASKTTTGVFASARIPNLSMDKVPDALAKADLKTKSFTLDNQTLSNYDALTINASFTDYTLIGVVGVHIESATNSGANPQNAVLRGFDFSGHDIKVYVRRRDTDVTTKVKVTVTGLYKK